MGEKAGSMTLDELIEQLENLSNRARYHQDYIKQSQQADMFAEIALSLVVLRDQGFHSDESCNHLNCMNMEDYSDLERARDQLQDDYDELEKQIEKSEGVPHRPISYGIKGLVRTGE